MRHASACTAGMHRRRLASALGRQSVDIRGGCSSHLSAAESTRIAITQVVDEYDQNVWFATGLRLTDWRGVSKAASLLGRPLESQGSTYGRRHPERALWPSALSSRGLRRRQLAQCREPSPRARAGHAWKGAQIVPALPADGSDDARFRAITARSRDPRICTFGDGADCWRRYAVTDT